MATSPRSHRRSLFCGMILDNSFCSFVQYGPQWQPVRPFEILYGRAWHPDHTARVHRHRHEASAGSIRRAYCAEKLGSSSGFDKVLQSCRNSCMHALVANIPIRLAWQGQDLSASVVLPLAALVDHTPETTPPWNSQEQVFNSVRQGRLGRDFSCSQNLEFSRVSESFSLGDFSLPSAVEPLTTPPSYCRDSLLKVFRLVQSGSAHPRPDQEDFASFSANLLPRTCSNTSAIVSQSGPRFPKARTGNRIKHRQDKGCYFFYKRPHLSKRRVSIREFIQPHSRTPPPRGTPGAPLGVNEECSPTLVGALAGKRGAQRRARRRRDYRLWRRFSTKVRGKRMDPSPLAPTRSSQAARSNARWFRNAILWQQQLRRRKRRKVVNSPTIPPLQYQSSFRVGTLNVQGFAETLKLKSALILMQTHNIDVLMLTETRSHSYYSYQSEGFLVILSGNKLDRFAGVGAIVAPRLRPHLLDVIQVSSRIIHLAFKMQGGNFHTVGAYAPHSGLDFEAIREPFWEQLQDHVSNIPQPEPVLVTGDFNVRFQAKHRNDGHCLGPFVYGKGPSFIDHSASSNRTLCRSFLHNQNLVEAASYKTPDLLKHITYRDKAAPPSDWSQFVLDPIPLQQIYTKLEVRLGELALDVSSKVRAYLTNESLLPPPTIPPQVDPIRFQRLDHCFVRHQWLNSVRSCRSLPFAGYPSDHYPLVTEVQVKLAKRSKAIRPHRRLHLTKVTESEKEAFNASLRKHLTGDSADPIPEDHSAAIHIFTDGSGTGGRCTAKSPAGWGFCYHTGEDWHDASGPVVTSSDHPCYVGAEVGSNNTGEVTAILEAVLHAIDHSFRRIVIHSDSAWAINCIKGKWRPKRHKALINYTRYLLRLLPFHSLEWIKAHAGHEGNERADALANRGKTQAARQGTSSQYPDPDHTAPARNSEVTFDQAIQCAAKEVFESQKLSARKPWITEATLEKLSAAKAAEASSDHSARLLFNQAKRSAKKDKVKWIHDQLLADPASNHSTVWQTVRRQKQGFRGRKSHLIVSGKPVPWTKTHEAFRDHLEQKQWAKNPRSEEFAAQLKLRPHLFDQSPDLGPFSLEELQQALSQTAKGKAPGPDGIEADLFKLLDHTSELALLDLYNQARSSGSGPETWTEATVVSIFKGKGTDTDPANYRPISLLNASYKIFAAMLKNRISVHCESKLRQTQFGFRPHRGTKHPLFILRRSMEWASMTGRDLHLLFLDWKQAFDSVDHLSMMTALRRFGLHPTELELISSFYAAATFGTQGFSDHTAKGAFCSGIRQGCPLSPYLFIIVLSVVLHDVDDALLSKGVPTNVWSVNHPFFDLEYADDTLLFSLTTPQGQSMLHALESEALLYGMSLNQSKTELLTNPAFQEPKWCFLNGDPVPTTEVVKYLGSHVSWTKAFDTAFSHRRALAEEAHKKLRLVWNSSLPRNEKLKIFQAVFIPTLIYGLDSLTLTTPHLKRIDAFYIRFLRRIVGIKASFYSRVPNTEVWETAGKPRLPSDFLLKAEVKFAAEVFAADHTSPLYTVVFVEPYKDRIQVHGRRRGHQIPYWLEVFSCRHFKEIWHQKVGILGPNHRYALISHRLRKPPFSETAPMRACTRARP